MLEGWRSAALSGATPALERGVDAGGGGDLDELAGEEGEGCEFEGDGGSEVVGDCEPADPDGHEKSAGGGGREEACGETSKGAGEEPPEGGGKGGGKGVGEEEAAGGSEELGDAAEASRGEDGEAGGAFDEVEDEGGEGGGGAEGKADENDGEVGEGEGYGGEGDSDGDVGAQGDEEAGGESEDGLAGESGFEGLRQDGQRRVGVGGICGGHDLQILSGFSLSRIARVDGSRLRRFMVGGREPMGECLDWFRRGWSVFIRLTAGSMSRCT